MRKRTVWKLSRGLGLSVLLACGGGDEDAAPKAGELDAVIARFRSAQSALCVSFIGCYPALNEEVDSSGAEGCQGPTADGGRHGYAPDDAQEAAEERACLERVCAREPRALVSFLDCLSGEADTVRACIEDSVCPADVTRCEEQGYPIERRCKQEATAKLAPVFESECGHWDD